MSYWVLTWPHSLRFAFTFLSFPLPLSLSFTLSPPPWPSLSVFAPSLPFHSSFSPRSFRNNTFIPLPSPFPIDHSFPKYKFVLLRFPFHGIYFSEEMRQCEGAPCGQFGQHNNQNNFPTTPNPYSTFRFFCATLNTRASSGP